MALSKKNLPWRVPIQKTEARRVVWRHPKGIYETVEVTGEAFVEPRLAREYRERAEAIGAVLGYIKRHKERVK